MSATEKMVRALQVVAITPLIRNFLSAHDPMALKQVDEAIAAGLASSVQPEMAKPINRLGAIVRGIGVIPQSVGGMPSWVVACELPEVSQKLHPLVVWVAYRSERGELVCTGGDYFNKVDEWRDAFWGRMAVHDAFLTVPPHAALHRPMPATVRQLGDPAFHR